MCLMLVGCHVAKPAAYAETSPEGSEQRNVIGEPIRITATWNASCTDWDAKIENMTAKHSVDPDPTKSCNEKPFHVVVACSARCEIRGNGTAASGQAAVEVVPLALGPLALTVTSTRSDNADHKTFALPQMEVVMPDRLLLSCWRDGKAAPCGPSGVAAAAPFISPSPHNALLVINGVPSPHVADVLSLAELYPQNKQGTGVRPGTYLVTLSIGAMTSHWQIEAR